MSEIADILGGVGSAFAGAGMLGSVFQGVQNYQLSRENLDYQKSLQQQIFNREDTAMQRRMKDAQEAGLNPYSVINSGGAGSGSVVKTDTPQLNLNMNGAVDAINAVLDMQARYFNTQHAKAEAENAVKTGFILDQDKIGKEWQNKIYGANLEMHNFNYYNAFLDTMRNMADFNFDFNTDFRFKSNGDNWDINKMYGNSRLGDTYFGTNKDSVYAKTRMNDYMYNQYMKDLAFYNYGEADYYYNNYLDKDYANRFAMQDTQRSMMEKEDSWYNWNQGFNMASDLFDSVTGLLFKKLDFGLKKSKGFSGR